MHRPWLHGMLAGAAGTTALNTTTYLDMVLRGRPGSTTPEQTVRKTEELTGRSVDPAGAETTKAQGRRSGLGALLGIATGLGAGLCYGTLRARLPRAPLPLMAAAAATAANVGGVAPMTALGVTDPRKWSGSSWMSDLVPHLAYGIATALTYEELERGGHELTTGSRVGAEAARKAAGPVRT